MEQKETLNSMQLT